MSIVRKVKAVEKVFDALDQDIHRLVDASGLHCIAGCGKCCFKADIEATPLEFLPYAFHLLQNKQIENVYAELLERESSICALFAPKPNSVVNGSCSEYKFRGLICRLFGFSAVRNKYGETKLISCAPLKEHATKQIEQISNSIEDGELVPMMNDYYFQIRSIDPNLGTRQVPINQAIKEALEVVMSYYAYRKPPKGASSLRT